VSFRSTAKTSTPARSFTVAGCTTPFTVASVDEFGVRTDEEIEAVTITAVGDALVTWHSQTSRRWGALHTTADDLSDDESTWSSDDGYEGRS
jgi:hypothetical protein